MCIAKSLLIKLYPKVFFCFIIFLFVLMSTAKLHAQDNASVPVTLHLRNASLKEVLKVIERQTSYSFIYADDVTNPDQTISIDADQKKLSEIMTQLAVQFGIEYHIREQVISIKSKAPISQPDSKASDPHTTEGIVTDQNGEPLVGVHVQVEGTSNGTMTDVDGHYRIVASEGQQLHFSFLGQKDMTLTVNKASNMDVRMEENLQQLDELVVTALGIQQESRELGYATQEVKGSTLETVKGVDVATSMTGKVAGLLIMNTTEFAQTPTIQLRGETPLLVIDGVPYGNMTLRDIPADNIERIDVLKGASASALYGYRGANGAIMVTTKMGAGGKGITVTFNSSSMFTAGYLAIPKQQSTFGRQIDPDTQKYYGTGSWGVPMEGQQVNQWDPVSKSWQMAPYLPIGKNNFKNFLNQGYILNNTVSVAQRGEFGSIRSSATWVENRGQYPNSQFHKYTYTLAGDIKIDKFQLTSSLAFNKQTSPNIGFSGYTGYDPMYNLLVWSSPDYDIRKYRDYWLVKNQSQNDSYDNTNNNPYFDRFERIHSVDRDVFNGFVMAAYDITSWLKATVRGGFDTYSDHQIVRISEGSLQGAGTATVITNGTQLWGESTKGQYDTGLGRGYSINSDFLLAANKTFRDFTIDALAGGTIFYTEDQGIEARTQGGLSIPGYYSLKASVNSALVNSSLSRRQVNSLYGKASISWKDMLYLDGTVRNDWSSTLPSSTRSYLYPSLAAGFVVSELYDAPQWMPFWKVRASWTTSKTPAGVYDINSVYSITNNAWGSLTSATYPTTVRGSNVRPQTAETWEFGTEGHFLKNRLTLDLTYYSKRMYDYLVSTSISSASGFTANYVNTKEAITRRGAEIAASFNVVKSGDWNWQIGANWSKYARYYTRLDPEFSADQPWIKVGKRVDAFTLNDFQRDGNGNLIYSQGLPTYSAYTSVHGYSDPNWIWGLNTQVNYKQFTLSISADGRVGGMAQTTTEMYMWLSGNHPHSVNDARYLDATEGGAHYVGDGVQVVSGTASYDKYGNITSDNREYAPNDVAVTYQSYVSTAHKGTAWGGNPSPLDAYKTTFFKIREVSLTYTMPQHWMKTIGAGSGSVSLIGQNLFLWAKQFKYSDPDGGTENFSDPSQRFIGCNLKVSF